MFFHCLPSIDQRTTTMTQTTEAVRTIKLTDIKFPKKCNVIFLNDDVTPMEFVTELLIGLFGHTHATAEETMIDIHNNGKGVAGVYDPEIAEQKSYEATQVSRSQGYPLTVDIEQV